MKNDYSIMEIPRESMLSYYDLRKKLEIYRKLKKRNN